MQDLRFGVFGASDLKILFRFRRLGFKGGKAAGLWKGTHVIQKVEQGRLPLWYTPIEVYFNIW